MAAADATPGTIAPWRVHYRHSDTPGPLGRNCGTCSMRIPPDPSAKRLFPACTEVGGYIRDGDICDDYDPAKP